MLITVKENNVSEEDVRFAQRRAYGEVTTDVRR